MTNTLTSSDLDLAAVERGVEAFIQTYYSGADDPTLPRLWALACFAEYARDIGVTAMADAVDRGFSLQQIGDALGVSKQAVGQRLLRARGATINHVAPARQRERLPGFTD